ncbi:hypothetical protein [Pseudobacteriovorax antillogorgiicola]|uniref:Spermine/spermidine synthase n=1 Tax=Pseudobacteriovorax antillogorgiicola TaxID=1513793 RepID=A0A1Y6BVC5_9BACT|nr:hypothetical protein [Pseudobacteriovorax antillogorgiicola]TCS52341.1 hypothetical protein EDD56_10985 [Pseudobacteriovorax antillogorgiicola]SMF29739.1 hypothetical protein SAMN06296036_109128 [Pseudobacteriovorax antillogorgiicola]
MAVIWQKQTSHKLYEVRTAGASKRLYTNGVLHTQYNPKSLMTGSVWDLLTLGGFFVPEGRLRRILVLGVGGGAALHQLNQLFSPDEIVGVELNRIHLTIGRRFFGLNQAPYLLVQDDAQAWIENYKGQPFDLIIDDMFGENYGEPFRVAKADQRWFGILMDRLSPEGALVLNFAETEDFNSCVATQGRVPGLNSGFRLSTGNCENIVGIYSRTSSSTSELRKRLREFPMLDTRRASCKLKYNIRTLY